VPPFGPVSRRVLIRTLHNLGFDGPYSGGKHQFMIRGEFPTLIPAILDATSLCEFCGSQVSLAPSGKQRNSRRSAA
jgi:hypothetical protein